MDRYGLLITIGGGRIEMAASTPYIDFHYNNSTEDYTGRIISDANAGVHLAGSTGSITYSSRTISPNIYLQGRVYSNGQIEAADYFMQNRSSAGGGYYIYGNNVQQGRLYLDTLGTTSAVGHARLTLGNSTASGTANNAYGGVLIYGTGSNWFYIRAQGNTANTTLEATGTRITYNGASGIQTGGWFRSTGNTGWYSETYGGGWYMTDGTYIRNYGSKQVLLNNHLLIQKNSEPDLIMERTDKSPNQRVRFYVQSMSDKAAASLMIQAYKANKTDYASVCYFDGQYGLGLHSQNYGSSLPSSGRAGQIFLKII